MGRGALGEEDSEGGDAAGEDGRVELQGSQLESVLVSVVAGDAVIKTDGEM